MRHIILAATLATLFLIAACSSPKPDSKDEETAASCTEPENPYTEGTGHYAGYEWAESRGGGSCNGSSQSFNEGCEEYEQQESEYQKCERKTK
jgi:hypothetical protein